eukprot:1398188-Pyramimonas_sp.AAC.1
MARPSRQRCMAWQEYAAKLRPGRTMAVHGMKIKIGMATAHGGRAQWKHTGKIKNGLATPPRISPTTAYSGAKARATATARMAARSAAPSGAQ